MNNKKQTVNTIACNKNIKQQNLRLALDLGTNSIGWAIYGLNQDKKPVSIVKTGVRIFSSGRSDKDDTTLNATRRQKRLQRRQRDRYLQRKLYLLDLLKKHALFPESMDDAKKLESLNPYELRAKGLDEKLDIHHLGRALFHINQKRGFKSSRKSSNEKEKGLIKQSVEASKQLMQKHKSRTYGEFLWKRFQQMEKNRKQSGSQQKHWVLSRKPVQAGVKDTYVVYSSRQMIEDEFNKLWDAQSRFHDQLKGKSEDGKNLKDKFFKAIFYQRPLKKPVVGICSLTGEKRIAKTLPLFQNFRILKELNNLAYINNRGESCRIVDLKQGIEFRDKIIRDLFLKKKKVTFKQIEKAFKQFFPSVDSFSQFNLDSFNRDFLEGDKTAYVLQKQISDWCKWALLLQNQFVELLEGENTNSDFIKNDDEILDDLKNFNEDHNLNLSQDKLQQCLNKSNQLPNGHGKYSKKAIQKIIPFLQKGHLESKAILLAGLGHHSDRNYKGDLLSKLPEYQEVLADHCVEMSLKSNSKNNETFRIPNPTVHAAFNQLRLVVNDIIRIYGKPLQVVIETARDLPHGPKTKKEMEKKNKENKERNRKACEKIEEFGQTNNRENRVRYHLWKEQNKVCVYSGQNIPKNLLWSSKLEVDHILPWSQTLDDGLSNKVLVYKTTNQSKSNKTPFNAFSSNQDDWEEILDRVKELPKNKQWRFRENAMKTFLAGEDSFLERQLNDIRYISKYAKNYLNRICKNVWTVRGQTTALIRHLLKFEAKNRDDHRNHAKDALAVGLVDRSFVKHISNIAKNIEGQNKEKNIAKAIKREVEPWLSFKEDAKKSVAEIIVSHRKRTKIKQLYKDEKGQLHNQTTGQLHNEKAYGFLSKVKDFSEPIDAIHYEDILFFDKWSEKKINEKIVSHKIKNDFLQEVEKNGSLNKDFLKDYHQKTGVRRIRIKEKLTVIPIKDKQGRQYKAFKSDGNHAMELFKNAKGKWNDKIISRFEANQKSFKPPAKKRILVINDMLFFDNRIWRVIKLSKNKITLSEHFEANVDKRKKHEKYKYETLTPGTLQRKNPKRVYVSPCGLIKKTNFNL